MAEKRQELHWRWEQTLQYLLLITACVVLLLFRLESEHLRIEISFISQFLAAKQRMWLWVSLRWLKQNQNRIKDQQITSVQLKYKQSAHRAKYTIYICKKCRHVHIHSLHCNRNAIEPWCSSGIYYQQCRRTKRRMTIVHWLFRVSLSISIAFHTLMSFPFRCEAASVLMWTESLLLSLADQLSLTQNNKASF